VTRGLRVLAAAVLLAQAAAVAPALVQAVSAARAAHQAERAPESVPDPWQPARLAARDLAPLMRLVPDDARVLLVAGVTSPCSWDAWVLPRPLRVLLDIDEALLLRAEREPSLRGVVSHWRRHVASRRMRLQPDLLAHELSRHDVLVLFQFDAARAAAAAGLAGVTLRPVASLGVATLHAVLRP